MIRTYSELIALPTFEQRFNYCTLNGLVGETTFGSFRYLNQAIYHGDRWKRLKNHLIDRDKACELAFDDYKIRGPVYLHHLNPVTAEEAEELLEEYLFQKTNLMLQIQQHIFGNLDMAIEEYLQKNLLLLNGQEQIIAIWMENKK
jgi:hypothetical protein